MTSTTPPTSTATTVTDSTTVHIVEEAYRAFTRGDIPAVLDLLDPQVSWTEAAGSAYPGTHVGHEAVVSDVFTRLGEDWESFTPEPSEYIAAGSTVVALGRFVGVHRTTGRRMTARFAHVFRLTDGRITAFESINDTHQVRAAMT